MPIKVTEKKQVPNIYLFYGSDSFSIAEKIATWRNRFTKKYSAAGISVFDCEESIDELFTVQRLKTALVGSTLFSATSLVIIKDVFSKKASAIRELLSILLPSLSDETFVVLHDERRDSTSEFSKLLTLLSKKGVCSMEEFSVPTGAALKNWITARAHTLGASFDPPTLTLFLRALEQQDGVEENSSEVSLWHIDNEIKKLASYCAGKPIRIHDVETLSCLPAPAHVFNLSDALLAGDTTTALRNAHRLAPLLRALAFLMTQFRSFLVLKNMEESGQSESAIAHTLTWNPKRVWIVRKKLAHHTTQSLKNAYSGLLDLERTIKTGSGDPLLTLDLFIKKTTEAPR